jgi:hypothetical protein
MKCINDQGNVIFLTSIVLFILIIIKGPCLFMNNSSTIEIFGSKFEQNKAIEVIIVEEKKNKRINLIFIYDRVEVYSLIQTI